MNILGLDIGSNSVGSAWISSDLAAPVVAGVSVFPAGVDEADEKRGEPKNAARRMTRRTRVMIARRSARKRFLRLRLMKTGLLPQAVEEFRSLLSETDPWSLRREGLDRPLSPHEFGRVLLHLAQRRGALGLKPLDPEDGDPSADEDGQVKAAIGKVRERMLKRGARTFGEFMFMMRAERVVPIHPKGSDGGGDVKPKAVAMLPIRNKGGSYDHCADRAMIRDEFHRLWNAQKKLGGPVAAMLTDDLLKDLDDESGNRVWRHQGLLFGQRRTYWDAGTLGRCVLDPTERCVPQADMYASYYRVVETLNNLKVIARGKEARALTPDEREKVKVYLRGPLGVHGSGKLKGQPKRSVNVTDLRALMGWGPARKSSEFRFNIETDEDREINTDWFHREIVHGAITLPKWEAMSDKAREGLNRAILKFDPEHESDADEFREGTRAWFGLDERQTEALIEVWRKRPKLDAKRLSMGRGAVRNLLALMDRQEPWPDAQRPGESRWLTQIEARRIIAADADFCDVTSGRPLDDHKRRRYATGAKGATSADRHYMRKHLLLKNGEPVIGPDGQPLAEPPPAPMIANPVVRKAIHEVRRHLVEYLITFGRKPDQIYVELAREARMGKMQADRALFRNRLRSRIRLDIIRSFDLESRSSTQQRAAVDRVVLARQQGGVCPLCGKAGLTTAAAVTGESCELSHILARGLGGSNGLGNMVLAHSECNRTMGRRTPREFWGASLTGGFEDGIAWVEKVYGEVERIKPSETRSATGEALWSAYFDKRDDRGKIEQFKKTVQDIQGMSERQDAATKYAARQVMSYLAEALYGGEGLPERSASGDAGDNRRRIFTTDGLWTSRLRREWGLFFDVHGAKVKALTDEQSHERKEKNRGDHRHHAIDAVVIALCSPQMRSAWEQRERQAETDGINTANEEAMDNYRRLHRLGVPPPFRSREALRDAIEAAVFGTGELRLPVCHRPVKRKLIGALHKATQYGPVLHSWVRDGQTHREAVPGRVTIRQDILGQMQSDFLKPAQLRMPRPETDEEAVDRLARRLRTGKQGLSVADATKQAKALVRSKAFTRRNVDPKPEKGGLVRDVALRATVRRRLEERGLDPDKYTRVELKKCIDQHGPLTMDSGVPIHRVVLLWSNNDPVVIDRNQFDYATGARSKSIDPRETRIYDSQNNHHIEIRAAKHPKKGEVWSGDVVTGFVVAKRKRENLRALRKANIPKPEAFRKLTRAERAKLKPVLAQIEREHPLVDRRDDEAKGGRFVMSLCEGETLLMRHKERPDEVGYFVVAKLDKPQSVVLVPHWDARSATARKDAAGSPVADSTREQFSATPSDLLRLAAPGQPHAVKVHVSPLGKVHVLRHD